MDLTKVCSVGSNIGSLVSGVGVVVGGAWAIVTYFRARQEERVASFRKDLADSVHEFSELAAAFQHQIVSTLEELFRSDNAESVTLIGIADAALATPDLKTAKEYLDSSEQVIHDSLLFGLSGQTHGFADTVRFRYATTISPLILFSPVLHLFFRDAGALVLEPYRRELSVNNLDDYFTDTVLAICRMKAAGKVEIKTQQDIRFHLRAGMAQHMTIFRRGVSLVKMISETLDVVQVVAQQYSNISHKNLWRHHKKDRHAPLSQLDQDTYAGTLRAIVSWKFKKHPDVLKKCLEEVDELEKLFGEDDSEEQQPANKASETPQG